MSTEANLHPPSGLNLLRWSDQVACAGLVVLSLAAMAIGWIHQGGWRGRLIDFEQARYRDIEFQLDINQAEWPEWAALPGIGEMLSKRIVESRRTAGPFRTHDDLRRVTGIGPRTLARIRPYLLPIAESSTGP